MNAPDPRTVFLKDYTPFTHLVERVELTFCLAPHATRVKARLHVGPNPQRPGRHDLRLDGVGLLLIRCQIAGKDIAATIDDEGMTLAASDLPQGHFTLETEVEIAPETNTALEGLYMSRGMYCTQCEAQGFRHITYYPDRPDVLARFEVRIEADLPVLLSNGNPTAAGQGWAEWHDPWPKPAYLFALVAGDLIAHSDAFVTMTGQHVALNIYVRQGDQDLCDYAMDSLIRSMRWDEQFYGRAYDLDVFNIVAVDDFNMGAMENKGLNIFNSKLVLASQQTATDDDFGRIESVIAHEYFHNWTGNRITCRDWFQLCLKEGLTVFRDQQFTANMRSKAVKRIEDVLTLRARQFREDAGPLAHPVRPESFVEINNFYTATVYEKGAEVIGMLKTLVGDAAYDQALTTYFDRHDGDAATIEDWLRVFEDVTGRDLGQFKRWYSQAGTPKVTVHQDWFAATGTLRVTLVQDNPPTPGQPTKEPQLIPIAIGLLHENGKEQVPTQILELKDASQSYDFAGFSRKPILSILREFSAPVILDHPVDARERAFLLAHDTDAFNRWEAGRTLAKDVLLDLITKGASPAMAAYLDAAARVTFDDKLDPAFRALVLRLPSEDEIAAALFETGHIPDPAQIYTQRRQLFAAMAQHMAADLPSLEASLRSTEAFSPDAASAGKRALRVIVLALLTTLVQNSAAKTGFAEAGNMTESLGCLQALLANDQGQPELEMFQTRWRDDRLVMDKWFAVQVALAPPQKACAVVEKLTQHPDFDWKNPNRFRSVFGAFCGNHAGFHHVDGAGYTLLADWLIRLDAVNPQTAARMSSAFETWRRFDLMRQDKIQKEFVRILAVPGLSRNLCEMVGRMHAA